jgi:lipopolysaccharide export system permease protein
MRSKERGGKPSSLLTPFTFPVLPYFSMFTRLDRYLLREALPPLLFGLIIYSTLAVISATLSRLQWIVGTPLAKLGEWLLLQLPTALVQTLPISLVLAVLLAFGRLAATNELQAVQAGGIPLARSARVFVLLGLFLAAVALSMHQYVLPKTNARVGGLYWELTSGANNGLFRLQQRNIPLEGYTLYFQKADRDTGEMTNARLEKWSDKWEDKLLTIVFAKRAQLTDRGLEMFDYQINQLDLSSVNTQAGSSEEQLQNLLRQSSVAPNANDPLVIKISETEDDLVTRFSEGGFEDTRSLSETYQDSQDETLPLEERRKANVLFQRKLAEPFANFTLLLVAVPLSLLYASSRSVAFGMSLLVTLVWYLLFTVGQLFAQAGSIPVWLGVWLGNIVLAALGIYLLSFRQRLSRK